MNKSISTILLIFYLSSINAQFNQFKKISIEPILKECTKSEEASKEDVECTYEKIYQEIDKIINSHDNSIYTYLRSFKLEVTWNKKGELKKVDLFNGAENLDDELSESINQYFRNLDFYPAKSLSGKKVKYKLTHFIRMENNQIRKDSIVKPMFPGCKDAWLSSKTMKTCASTSLLEFIYKNLNYPAEARKNKTEGIALIKFIVNTDGFIEDITISQDPGDGCGQAALDIIQKMNDSGIRWTPGKINGIARPISYAVPVKFKLAG